MLTFSVDRQLITTTLKPNREKDEIAAAEATLVYHGVRHEIPYLAQQCTTNVLKSLFPSSSIASSLSCGCTKAAVIATDVLAPYFTHHVIITQVFALLMLITENKKSPLAGHVTSSAD
ncbi:unnamed protein product [Rotaria magnacalcarata]|uniref:Uncharacterized protein n=1 Tax=Rotaria magnacalcarata TaxID=392030 RepID=A0A816ZZI7_9BILA|nr:unnamed protein product [Rotaria magnacalcarata]CAF2245514.1 unnamed protein product [Rotaria magnacalcarata]CAF3970552.1 unnamed protein product [Rotaria magnacalcarata]CAF4073575.1 unnamed protein product [Rotaria magnacalcarata]